jgi:hypothetical protein
VARLGQVPERHRRRLLRDTREDGDVAHGGLLLAEDADEVRAQGERQLGPGLEVERVREERLREQDRELRRSGCLGARPRREAHDHAVRAGDDRDVLRKVDVEAADDRFQRAPEIADGARSEPLAPALVDLVEQRGPDLLRRAAGRSGPDEPFAAKAAGAPVPVPLLLRRAGGRRRSDEDVAPALHPAEGGEHASLGKPCRGGELADGDPVADEAQEVRPHDD